MGRPSEEYRFPYVRERIYDGAGSRHSRLDKTRWLPCPVSTTPPTLLYPSYPICHTYHSSCIPRINIPDIIVTLSAIPQHFPSARSQSVLVTPDRCACQFSKSVKRHPPHLWRVGSETVANRRLVCRAGPCDCQACDCRAYATRFVQHNSPALRK